MYFFLLWNQSIVKFICIYVSDTNHVVNTPFSTFTANLLPDRRKNHMTYKDEKRGTWYCKFYYIDWTGVRRQKMKRGFKLQRDAKEWERIFLEKQSGSPNMTFQALYQLYLEDIQSRLKRSSVNSKNQCVESRVLPFFKDKPINQITAADVRKWQNHLIEDGLKPTTQRNVNGQLNAILNFAVKYYGLPQNPCKVAGLIGSSKPKRMQFWTHEEFKTLIACVKNPTHHVLYSILYYAGLRCGEALALTPADIDLEKKVIHVTKTFHRIHGEDVITSPKTSNSIRTVPIPDFLCDQIRAYIQGTYGVKKSDRLIPLVNTSIRIPLNNVCERAGVKQIRVHDIRHSHVSLLIEMGFPAILIAERIGDTVDMVNNIYGHLYPNRHEEVADMLQALVSK